jgi:Family of unknown function (DUF5335)
MFSASIGSPIVVRNLQPSSADIRASRAIIEVLKGLDHLIRKPRELHVATDDGRLASLEIVDDEGVRQIVRLKDPMMLPSLQQ